MAHDLLQGSDHDPQHLIRQVYGRCLSRAPTPLERVDCVAFFEQQRRYHHRAGADPATAVVRSLTDLCHVMFNLNEFVYID